MTSARMRHDVASCLFRMDGTMAEERVERRLTAILAADVAGYSRLMGADEEGTLAALKTLRREVADPKIKEHRGRISRQDGRQIVSRAKVAPHSLLREVGKRAKLWERLASARIVEHQTRNIDGVFIESGFHLAFLDVAHH